MTKAPNRFANDFIFCAALLLMLGLGAQMTAHADDFAAVNAALLDPFDPVPQIRFSDCYDRCGGRRCYDSCGYHRRRCWHDCWHHEDERQRWLWNDEHEWRERIHEFDFDTHRWNDAMERYSNQADRYDHFMRWGPTGPHDVVHTDYGWWQDGGHWRYWHGDRWHDDGDDDHWHDGHHDGGHHDDHH